MFATELQKNQSGCTKRSTTLPVKGLSMQWKQHDLQVSINTCIADVRLYIGSVALFRFRFVSWLFVQTTKGPQKALDRQLETGLCPARAEGIARLYLGGRKSVVLHNHFPILLEVPTSFDSDWERVAVALIKSLAAIAQEPSQISKIFRAFRIPARFCDLLHFPKVATHFALLRQGLIYSIPLPNVDEVQAADDLKIALDAIVAISPDASSLSTPRLGELTALPRAIWSKIYRTIKRQSGLSSEVGNAIDTLKNAAFLVCIDDDTTPNSLSETGHGLRFKNLANRYFDKCLQFVVFGNGQCGFLCDHSVIDGVEAMHLATKIQAGLSPLQDTKSLKVKDANLLPTWQPFHYKLPPSLGLEHRVRLDKQISRVFSTSIELASFNRAFFSTQNCPADTLIQLAIQLCFFRCHGVMPSVFEPVSLSHLPGGRLDFISPVSAASRDLVLSMIENLPTYTQGTQDTQFNQRQLLAQAIQHHRKAIRQTKDGLGAIGHLLALSALEFPNQQRAGATWLRFKESLFASIDPGSRLLTQRDIVASNGSEGNGSEGNGGRSNKEQVNTKPKALRLFGTMTHRDDLFGIGYLIHAEGITFDIQANGKYSAHGEAFASELPLSITDIAKLASDHLPNCR
jgi:carnitine O-acetyltransferase